MMKRETRGACFTQSHDHVITMRRRRHASSPPRVAIDYDYVFQVVEQYFHYKTES